MSIKLIESNINTLADIWNYIEGHYCTYEELVGRHGLVIDMMYYNSLLAALPRLWKHIIKDWTEITPVENKIQIRCKSKYISKQLYWSLIEREICYIDASCYLWAKDLAIDPPELLSNNWKTLLLAA